MDNKLKIAAAGNASSRHVSQRCAALLVLLVGLGSCRTVPDDPKYRYDIDKSPLDKATVGSMGTEDAIEAIGKTILELVRKDPIVPAVERVLTDYGAECRRETARLRCAWGKAQIGRIPSPIPFIEARHEHHTDVQVSAEADRWGKLRLQVCVDRITVRDRDELIAHPRKAAFRCRSFPGPPPSPGRRGSKK